MPQRPKFKNKAGYQLRALQGGIHRWTKTDVSREIIHRATARQASVNHETEWMRRPDAGKQALQGLMGPGGTLDSLRYIFQGDPEVEAFVQEVADRAAKTYTVGFRRDPIQTSAHYLRRHPVWQRLENDAQNGSERVARTIEEMTAYGNLTHPAKRLGVTAEVKHLPADVYGGHMDAYAHYRQADQGSNFGPNIAYSPRALINHDPAMLSAVIRHEAMHHYGHEAFDRGDPTLLRHLHGEFTHAMHDIGVHSAHAFQEPDHFYPDPDQRRMPFWYTENPYSYIFKRARVHAPNDSDLSAFYTHPLSAGTEIPSVLAEMVHDPLRRPHLYALQAATGRDLITPLSDLWGMDFQDTDPEESAFLEREIYQSLIREAPTRPPLVLPKQSSISLERPAVVREDASHFERRPAPEPSHSFAAPEFKGKAGYRLERLQSGIHRWKRSNVSREIEGNPLAHARRALPQAAIVPPDPHPERKTLAEYTQGALINPLAAQHRHGVVKDRRNKDLEYIPGGGTDAMDLPPLAEDVWYHGTKHSGFDAERLGHPGDIEDDTRGSRHWNLQLGTFMADDPRVAAKFTRTYWTPPVSEDGGRVIPVRLHVTNPLVLDDEADLDAMYLQTAFKHGKLDPREMGSLLHSGSVREDRKAAYHGGKPGEWDGREIDQYGRPRPELIERALKDPAMFAQLLDDTEYMRRRLPIIAVQRDESMMKRSDKVAMGQLVRAELIAQGYDGIVHGGNLEGGRAAIALDPKNIAISIGRRNHFVAVRDALQRGQPVPPEVLAEYPTLAPGYKPLRKIAPGERSQKASKLVRPPTPPTVDYSSMGYYPIEANSPSAVQRKLEELHPGSRVHLPYSNFINNQNGFNTFIRPEPGMFGVPGGEILSAPNPLRLRRFNLRQDPDTGSYYDDRLISRNEGGSIRLRPELKDRYSSVIVGSEPMMHLALSSNDADTVVNYNQGRLGRGYSHSTYDDEQMRSAPLVWHATPAGAMAALQATNIVDPFDRDKPIYMVSVPRSSSTSLKAKPEGLYDFGPEGNHHQELPIFREGAQYHVATPAIFSTSTVGYGESDSEVDGEPEIRIPSLYPNIHHVYRKIDINDVAYFDPESPI